MTSHRILQLNALSTAVCAIGMLATRETLHPLFGLAGPGLFDVLAAGLLAYAGALAITARRRPIGREALIAFAIADVAWVVGSALVLLLFWGRLAPVARLLVIIVGLAVEAFATLQFRAARVFRGHSPRLA
jgi:hypothetical protein